MTDNIEDKDGKGTEENNEFEVEKTRLISESKKYRLRAQAAETKISELEGNVLSQEALDEYNSLKASANKASDKKLRDKGDFDKLMAEKQNEFTVHLDAEKAKANTYLSALQQVAVADRLKNELATRGVKFVDEASFLLQNKFSSKAVAEIGDNGINVRVVNASDGNAVIDADCEPGKTIGLDKLVEQFLASSTGQIFLPPSGDTGSGSHPGISNDKVTIEQLDADPDLRKKWSASHTTAEYMQLAMKNRDKNKPIK